MDIRFTHDFKEAQRLAAEGFEPIECAFGQHESVLGPFAMDHHGAERHREGVAIRACRDHFGALRDDPRFVVTGTPDADAVLAIIALAGLAPQSTISPAFYEIVERNDVDPINSDLFESPEGEALAWFNQRQGLTQSEAGFRAAIKDMLQLLNQGISKHDRAQIRRSDTRRRAIAREGVIARFKAGEILSESLNTFQAGPLLRGDAARPWVLAVESVVWGFDVWYRWASVVVSFSERARKITIGCPDEETAVRLFGPNGLEEIWPRLGQGWGGRGAIGGSPRGVRKTAADASEIAREISAWIREG